MSPGLTEPVPTDYFARPFSEQEFASFPAIDSLYPQGKTGEAFPVPPPLRLPAEYQELLAYPTGGVIVSNHGIIGPPPAAARAAAGAQVEAEGAAYFLARRRVGRVKAHAGQNPQHVPVSLLSAAQAST